MKHFFAEPNNIYDKTITLSAQDAKQLRLLQYDANKMFIVCDGNGTNYVCQTGDAQAGADTQDGEMTVQILSKHKSNTEPSVECSVYMAYAKTERLDSAVHKSVELGACKIVLYNSELCIDKPRSIHKKVERLQKIALKAAKQSWRGIIPEVSAVDAIDEFRYVLDTAAGANDLVILYYGNEKNLKITTILDHYFPLNIHFPEPLEKVRSVAIITGPEDGFTPLEINLAQSKGISFASQGPRPLRSDTAPLAALAAIMYHTGNL